MLYAELDAFEPVAIHEHDAGDGWRVFVRTAALRDSARATLAAEFGNALLDLSPLDVDDEDWARRSQATLKAIRAGRIIVAPPWDVPRVDAGRDPEPVVRDSNDLGSGLARRDPRNPDRDTIAALHDPGSRIPNSGLRIADPDVITIVILPSMGFGTGHHATTRLCLELLQEIDLRGKRVIDVGTGSGVLAVAAWKLGAEAVTAVDYDPDALQNARENVATNGGADAIRIVEADLAALQAPPADVVLANLTGAALQRFAGVLRVLVTPGGVLIVSGFPPGELTDVVRALDATVSKSGLDGDWAAALLTIAS